LEQSIIGASSAFDNDVAALSIDLNVYGLQTIPGVSIESLGVFSYRAHLSAQSFLALDLQQCKKNEA